MRFKPLAEKPYVMRSHPSGKSKDGANVCPEWGHSLLLTTSVCGQRL